MAETPARNSPALGREKGVGIGAMSALTPFIIFKTAFRILLGEEEKKKLGKKRDEKRKKKKKSSTQSQERKKNGKRFTRMFLKIQIECRAFFFLT